jgi:hypothetical protein
MLIPATSPKAPASKPKGVKKPVVIGMMAFAVMNFMTVVSLRGLPAQAEYGLVSIFYYIFAAVVFLIPTALVAAELASAFPKQGGMFRWVGEAFGPRWGFAALYWQWQAWVLWLPAVLVFGAAALAFTMWPQSFDTALASNKIFSLAILLIPLLGDHGVHVSRHTGIRFAEYLQRYFRHHRSRRDPDCPWRRLCGDGPSRSDVPEDRVPPRFRQLAQHGARCQYLSFLRRYGNAGGPREESEESRRAIIRFRF